MNDDIKWAAAVSNSLSRDGIRIIRHYFFPPEPDSDYVMVAYYTPEKKWLWADCNTTSVNRRDDWKELPEWIDSEEKAKAYVYALYRLGGLE